MSRVRLERSLATKSLTLLQHPHPSGTVLYSPGGHFCYRVIGPCCRLFDREQLPWPCCRIQWRGKEPSWRRIGRRLIPDLAAKGHPSYCVEILGLGNPGPQFILTLYTVKLSAAEKEWWCASKPNPAATVDPPAAELEGTRR